MGKVYALDRKRKLLDTLAVIFVTLFTLAGILVSLNRYWQYESLYYDLGIFDTAIWKVAHFQAPIIDHVKVGGESIFADHFSPAIFLLSMVYWVTSRREMLLVVQALCVGASGFVLYHVCNNVTKSKVCSFAILSCYFFFLGLQNAVITDFHEVTLATLPLSLIYYCFVKQKKRWFLFFLLFFLLFKESNFLAGIGIGISVFLLDRKWKKEAVLSAVISLVYGIVVIKGVIPHFGKDYIYTVPIHFTQLFTSFIDNSEKLKTMFYSFSSFGFLPLLSPAFYILFLQDFFTRFYSPVYATRYGLGFHYSALLAMFLSLSCCYAISYLRKIKIFTKHIVLIGFLLFFLAALQYRFILRGPFALSYNRAFYSHTKDFSFLNDLVSRVPTNATVMAQNNLAVRFTHNPFVWVLRKNYGDYNPEYIVIDVRPGQNPADFYLTEKVPKLMDYLARDKINYTLFYRKGDMYIYKRVKSTK